MSTGCTIPWAQSVGLGPDVWSIGSQSEVKNSCFRGGWSGTSCQDNGKRAILI